MNISFIKLANWAAFGFATFIVSTTLIFAYLILYPVDVLTNWKMTVEEKTYHPTEEINLLVDYTKLREVSGVTYHYLECENKNKSQARYLLSINEATRASHPDRVDTALQVLRLPVIVPDLPKRCRIAVTVDYTMYTFRRFTENTTSNWFMMEEK